MNEYVLDASAVMALIQLEQGWELVEDVRPRLISSVNLSEAVSSLTNKGFSFVRATRALGILDLTVVDFDEPQAIETARLRPLTKAFGLSLGDRACLALATIRSLPVLTADRVWAEAAPHLAISRIR